jgi:hypothetical protein
MGDELVLTDEERTLIMKRRAEEVTEAVRDGLGPDACPAGLGVAGTRSVDIQPLGERLSHLAEIITRELGEDGVMVVWTWKGSVAEARSESVFTLFGQLGDRIWLRWSGPDIDRAAAIDRRYMPKWSINTADDVIVAQAVEFVRPLLPRIWEALGAAI